LNPLTFADSYKRLVEAIESDDIEAVKILVGSGETPCRFINFEDYDYKRTALHLACKKADLPIVQRLIAAGANIGIPDLLGSSPQHCAAEAGSLPIVEYLLKSGADLNAVDGNRRIPLHCAAEASES
jgi:ankyrin repeat protein